MDNQDELYNEDSHAQWSLLNDAIKGYKALSAAFNTLDVGAQEKLDKAEQYLTDLRVFSVEFIEALLSKANKYKQWANGEIVKYLLDHNQQSATMQDGTKIALKTEVSVKVNGETDEEKEQSKQALYAWVAEQGEGDHIKDVVKFAAGSVNDALFETLDKGGYSYTHDRQIHPQTLNKIMRDRVESGEPLPPIEIAEIKPFIRATVK